MKFEVKYYMSRTDKIEFYNIIEDIINYYKFQKLDNELHHGITRYDHSLRVAKATYYVGKKLRIKKLNETVRAALLHDYYLDSDLQEKSSKEKLSIHPEIACHNAYKDFNITNFQQNIIRTHMFPLSKELPKYKESWLVTVMDKSVAAYEMYRFKFSLVFSVWALFIFNMLTIQK